MARRSASPDKLTIKGLSAEDQDWLRAESERLGCDPENLVRMMIRQRSGAIVVGYPPPPGYREPRYYEDRKPYDGGPVNEIFAAPPGANTETINEAEPSLDALMAAGPTLLDDSPAPQKPRIVPFTFSTDKRYDVPLTPAYRRVAAPAPYPRGGFDAFTETEFVTINPAVIGANMMGDGAGNVRRDNLRHFGVVGTRRR